MLRLQLHAIPLVSRLLRQMVYGHSRLRLVHFGHTNHLRRRPPGRVRRLERVYRFRVVGQLEYRCSMSVIAVAVLDTDGAAHGSADGDAHRNPVVRANGRAFVSADIPAFGRYYSRTDRGAHLEAHGGADGRE